MRLPRPGRAGGWLLPALLVLALVVLASTATSLVLERRDRSEPAPLLRPAAVAGSGTTSEGSPVARQAVALARRAVQEYFTVGHDDPTRTFARVRRLATPGFRDRYDETAARLADRLRRDGIDLAARLVPWGTATEWLTAERAQVLVAVDVTTTRSSGSGTAPYRVRVSLDRDGDRWRLAGLDEVT